MVAGMIREDERRRCVSDESDDGIRERTVEAVVGALNRGTEVCELPAELSEVSDATRARMPGWGV